MLRISSFISICSDIFIFRLLNNIWKKNEKKTIFLHWAISTYGKLFLNELNLHRSSGSLLDVFIDDNCKPVNFGFQIVQLKYGIDKYFKGSKNNIDLNP